METKKCPKCQLVNWLSANICKRCSFSFTNTAMNESFQINNLNTQKIAFSANQDVKGNAWKKIKWGLIISIIGFAITSGAIYLGVFQGYENTDNTYLKLAKLFSLITFLPLSFVLAGAIEIITGLPISDIIKKWEELPHWLGWLLGISVFLLIVTLIIVVAAVILFNFF
jgi:hypothetical protein